MNLPDVPLFSMLRERMNWLHSRQDLLAQNVANADTPGYASRDLKPLDFEAALNGSRAMTTTNARHIAVSPSRMSKFEEKVSDGAGGHAVSLELEMIKVADTQAQFAAVSNLYAKAMTLMKTAIGH